MTKATSLIAYHAEHQAELDLLADVEGLFVLGFLQHSRIRQTWQLQQALLWDTDRLDRVIGRLTANGALAVSAAGQSAELSLSPMALSALELFQENSHGRERRQKEAEDFFRRGIRFGQNPRSADQAIHAYSQALELDPTHAGALLNLGSIYLSHAQHSTAADCFRKALAAKPDYALAHFNLALVYHEQRQPAPAEMHYKSAILLAPEYCDPYFNLAVLYEENGKRTDAAKYWQKYLTFDQDSKWAGIARERLSHWAQPHGSSALRAARESSTRLLSDSFPPLGTSQGLRAHQDFPQQVAFDDVFRVAEEFDVSVPLSHIV
jgi:tetratricopeptide (TPR) repeat protein